MSLIQITDNCDWTHISNLTSEEKIEMHINNLQKIANVNIREVTLAENPNLLIEGTTERKLDSPCFQK